MAMEQCIVGVCFIPLETSGQKLFGFAEFLSGLALMVLAWTIADVRYRFRIQTAPLPLQGLTFAVVAGVGTLALLTDLWRAQGWLVPSGKVLTPASWQALLGGTLLLTFLMWAWFAFIRPPTYGKRNARRFARTLYRFVLKSSPDELAVVADELGSSADALVRHATDRSKHRKDAKRSEVASYADDILLLIADQRLCKAIVASAPGTAAAFFEAMSATGKYNIQIETFAGNIASAALANKGSFLYHEVEGYRSGLFGYHKPLTLAMLSNYALVSQVDSLLDPDFRERWRWDAEQWDAYCRAVLVTFRAYLVERPNSHSTVLFRAIDILKDAARNIGTIDGRAEGWADSDALAALDVPVQFIERAVAILNDQGIPTGTELRIRGRRMGNVLDQLAELAFEVIFAVSRVRSPPMLCWSVQHNAVWGKLFDDPGLDSPAGRVVRFKVRRLLYAEILKMENYPNYKGAGILAVCLNVMGLQLAHRRTNGRQDRALHKVVLAWTVRNYCRIHDFNPKVAAACLVENLTFDATRRRLAWTAPNQGLDRDPRFTYLELDPCEPQPQQVRD